MRPIVQVTISGNDADEILTCLRTFEKVFSARIPSPAEPVGVSASSEAPAKKRGRPQKTLRQFSSLIENGLPVLVPQIESSQHLEQAPNICAEAPLASAGSELTLPPEIKGTKKEEAAIAMSEVHSRKGISALVTILGGFGVARFKELKEEQYEEFITACKKGLE